jgi:hypothetical protein
MLRSLIHTSEHQAFYGVVCGDYLRFEGTNDKKKKKKQPKPNLRGRAPRTEFQAAPPRNPIQPSIFGINTADLSSQAVPSRSSNPGVRLEKAYPWAGTLPYNTFGHIVPSCMTIAVKMRYDQICGPRFQPPTRLQPLFPIRSSQTRKLSIFVHVVD